MPMYMYIVDIDKCCSSTSECALDFDSASSRTANPYFL